MMNETAPRETFRIKGETVISANDYASGKKVCGWLVSLLLSNRLAYQGWRETKASQAGWCQPFLAVRSFRRAQRI